MGKKNGFEVHLLNMPTIPIEVDPSSRRHLMAEHIFAGLENFFPPVPLKKKLPFLSDGTFDLMQQRAKVNHANGQNTFLLVSSTFIFVFAHWRAVACRKIHTYSRPWWCKVRGPKIKKWCSRQVRYRHVLADLTRRIRKGVVDDLSVWILARTTSLEEAALENCSRALYRVLHQLQPSQAGKDYRLLNSEGIPASCDKEERLIVKDHFQAKLEGSDSSMLALVTADRNTAPVLAVEHASIIRSLDAVPDITFLINKNARAKFNGLGETPIGGEVLRLAPRTMAHLAHPLHVQAAMQIRLPLQWLGGCLVELWKKIGSRAFITNFRDITLSDGEAKHFLGFLRTSIRTAVQALAGPGQCGSGFGAGATDTCHMLLTQAMCLARLQKKSLLMS